jgi:hypothetical protein
MDRAVRTLKEVARHLLHCAGLRRRAAYLAHPRRAERFADIYRSGVWRHGDGQVPDSGEGSSLGATQNIREALPSLLDRLGTKTLVDIGCGDFTWAQALPIRQNYVGVDLVPEIIERNNRLHANERRRFLLADGVEDELPDGDTVLCREVLFHLSFADIGNLLTNILAKPRRFFIATTDAGTLFNADIVSGDFRLLNLHHRPFYFPSPLETIIDASDTADRYLGVWPAVAAALKRSPSAIR